MSNYLKSFKTGVATINSAIAGGNQQVISQLYNSINGLQTAMTQQNFDITSAIKDCCCNMREAISGVNLNISQQTNTLQNQMMQNSFAAQNQRTQIAFANERAFCQQNALIREEGNATRAAFFQSRYDDLLRENCALKAKAEMQSLKTELLAAIAASKTTTTA